MPRKPRTKPVAAHIADQPATSGYPEQHPDPSVSEQVAEALSAPGIQQQAAAIVDQVAESMQLPNDAAEPVHTPDTSFAEHTRHPVPRESGLTYHRSAAGVRLGEGFRLVGNVKVRESVVSFPDKPGEEVIAAMKEAGFSYRAADKLWTRPVHGWQDRLHAERAFEAVAGLAGPSV